VSRSALVRLDWADGEYSFRLGMAQLEELDDNCGVGPGFALNLVNDGMSGNWKAKLLREVIRLGLIGAGTAPVAAAVLVKRYVDDRPLGESLLTTQAILGACVVGVKDDMPGEGRGRRRTTGRPSPTAASASPTSTAPARRAASPLTKSAAAASGKSPRTSKAGARPTAAMKTKRSRPTNAKS
jgi:hypothetical protein